MRACSSPCSATTPSASLALAGLRSLIGYLQSRLASELTLKHTPTLDFHYDDSLDRSLRIQSLLEEERER